MSRLRSDGKWNAIQTFPVHGGTFVSDDDGIAGDLPVGDFMVIHALAGGTVTFNFPDHSLSIPVVNGDDYGIGRDCLSISSDCKVVLS